MTNFNLTEEAFILSSLKEVVHVWARGSGQATFNLNIVDGVLISSLVSDLDIPLIPTSLKNSVSPIIRVS